jgi:hypothetical protein
MKDPKLIYKSEKPYTEDINDLIEKGGKGSGVKGHTTQKLKEIHDYHSKNSSKQTQESMKRYLDPKVTDKESHAYRVETEHATMGKRPSEPEHYMDHPKNSVKRQELFFNPKKK